MNNNNKNNNNKMNNQKPVSAHPDPTTPNQSNGVNDEKNKTAPVSAHPDPVVPNVQQGVEEKKHDAEKHAPHHPGTPESKVPEQHDKKNIQIIILTWGSLNSTLSLSLLLWLLREYVQSSSNQVLSCNGHMINYHMI